MASIMHVTVDHRERSNRVIAALRDKGCEILIAQLKLGDYLVDDKLIVERKTLPDFGLSIIDGRIFRQANGLAWSEPPSVIILEGGREDADRIPVKRASMQGAMITLSLVYKIPILRSMNPEETASLMMYAAHQLSKQRNGALRVPGYRPKGKRKQQLRVLQGLPGVGPSRAERLLNYFGSIEADPEELCQVKGVGSDVAGRIRNIVKEPRMGYCTLNESLFDL